MLLAFTNSLTNSVPFFSFATSLPLGAAHLGLRKPPLPRLLRLPRDTSLCFRVSNPIDPVAAPFSSKEYKNDTW